MLAISVTREALIKGLFPITVSLECTRKIDGQHFHNYTQIWYVLSGTLKHTIGDKTFLQEHGSFVLVPPYTRHFINTADSEDTPVYVSISFIDSFLTDFGYRYFSFTQPHVRFNEYEIPSFKTLSGAKRELADMLMRRINSEFSKHFSMDYNILRELLVEFIRIVCVKGKSNKDIILSKERAEAISKAVNYINNHYNEKITIDSLCQISVMSRRVFTDSFKAVTGLTVAEFITIYRMCKARHYILFTDKNLGEIAEITGFCDKAHLSRKFKQHYKSTPSEYKNENQKDALISDKECSKRWDWIYSEKPE